MKRIYLFIAIGFILICGLSVYCFTITDKSNESAEAEMTADVDNKNTIEYEIYPDDKLVALTFDDGPKGTTTDRILDVLEAYNSKATFFVVGYNTQEHIDNIKRIVSLGCEIGNHTFSHTNLEKCKPDERTQAYESLNDLIFDITGIKPTLLRAPGGNIKSAAEEIEMPLVMWSIDTNDWKMKDSSKPSRTQLERAQDIDKIVQKVLSEVEPGKIILMHDIYEFSADVTTALVPKLIDKGYKLATVSDMFAFYGNELKNGTAYREAVTNK